MSAKKEIGIISNVIALMVYSVLGLGLVGIGVWLFKWIQSMLA